MKWISSGILFMTVLALGAPRCACAQAGPVLCWGDNSSGQLGNSSLASHNVSAAAFYVSGIKAVSAGWLHTLALSTDGHVYSWGYNFYGQLGLGDNADRTTPERVPGVDHVIDVAAGAFSSYALKDDGTLYAWGTNSNGELGIGFVG